MSKCISKQNKAQNRRQNFKICNDLSLKKCAAGMCQGQGKIQGLQKVA